MAQDNVKLVFDILSGKDTLSSALEKTKSSVGGLEVAFSALKSFAAPVLAGLTFAKAIESAMEAEEAVHSLNVALAASGNYSKKASEDLQAFAKSLQEVTTYSDEAILRSASYLENLTNLDTQGLKKATKASMDLAAALHMDLESAATLVAKSIEGVGAGLQRYGIRVKEGKNETERLNNTMTALAQFTGQAEAKSNTFGGSLAKLKNQFDELLEVVGNGVVQNGDLVSSINSISKELVAIAGPTARFVKDFILFGKIVKNTAEIAIESINFVFSTFVDIVIYKPINLAISAINKLRSYLGKENLPKFTLFEDISAASFQGIKDDVKDIADAFKDSGKQAKKLGDEIKNLAGSKMKSELELQIRPTFAKLSEELSKLGDVEGFKNIKRKFEDFGETLKRIDPKTANYEQLRTSMKNLARDVEDLKIKAKEARLSLPSLIDTLFTSVFSGRGVVSSIRDFANSVIESLTSKDLGPEILKKNLEALKAFGQSVTSAIAEGKEGARKAVVAIISGVAQNIGKAFGPVGEAVGSALGPIFNLLSQGPEKTRAAAKEFSLGIVEFAKNIAISAPYFIQGLIDALPELVRSLVASIPQLIDAMIASTPRLVSSFIAQIPNIVAAFISEIGKQFGQTFTGGGLLGGITGGGGGGGIIGGIVGGIGDVFGFKGGESRFKSAPQAYMASSSSNDMTNVLLNQILANLQKPITVHTSVEVNRREFANIILDLNRTNARLA